MGKYVSLKVTQSIVTKSGGLKQLRHWPHDYCSWMIMLVFFFIDIMKNHCLVDKIHNGGALMLVVLLISIVTCLVQIWTIYHVLTVESTLGGGIKWLYSFMKIIQFVNLCKKVAEAYLKPSRICTIEFFFFFFFFCKKS